MADDLPQLPDARPRNEEFETSNVIVLPPADRGIAAWKFLFGCFVVEGVLWGFPMAYGVFQEHYSRESEFAVSENIAIVGTMSSSIYFFGAPFATPFVKRFTRWRFEMILIGTITCILSLVAASFAHSTATLIATQGTLYGIGFLVVYFPLLSMLNEWFVQRRSFAYAVVYAGGGFSGACLPFLFEWLLSKYGFRTTLRISAIAQLFILAPILHLIRARLPNSHGRRDQPIDMSFLASPLFWVLMISNLSQSFAYYIPSLYLPTFSSGIGLSRSIGALVLATHNMATVFGQLSFGYLSDRLDNIFSLVMITGTFSSVATFTLWGFANSFAPLLAFSMIYGFFAGSYVVFWSRYGMLLSNDPQPIFSLMAFGKGIGNICTAPISERLLGESFGSRWGANGFGPLIIYLGSLMLFSSFGGIGWLLRR